MDALTKSMLTSIGKDTGRAGAGLLTTLVQNDLPMSRSQREQNEWAERQAEVAYERENEFYQNHQTIGAKVDEAQEAGVNPAAIYGNVGGSSAPSVPQASSSAPAVSDLISAVTNMVMRGKELDLQQALLPSTIAEKEANANAANASAGHQQSLTSWQNIQNEVANATKQTNIELINESLKKLKNEVSKSEYDATIAAHGVSKAFFESLIIETEYLYSQATYEDRVKLAHYQTMYQEYLAKGEQEKAAQMRNLLKSQIANNYAQANLANASAREIQDRCIQFYETTDKRGKSLFQNKTEGEIKDLRSRTYYNYAAGEYQLSASAKADKETDQLWLKYVNTAVDVIVPIAAGTLGFVTAGPAGAAVGIGASGLLLNK